MGMPQETKERLSAALKAKWASGTRKPNPPSTYEKSSKTMRELYRSGKIKPGLQLTREVARRGRASRSYESVVEANRRAALKRRGRPNSGKRNSASPEHWKARYWKLKSPCGQIIEGWNLNDLVRKNSHLFNADDLIWRNSRCRASHRLRGLYETNEKGETRNHEWRGWVALQVNDWGKQKAA